MSYIRCLSNPERLYIYSDGKFTHVNHNVPKPLSSGKKAALPAEFSVPTKVFDRVCKLWSKFEEADVEGCRAEEQGVFVKTGKKVPARWDPLHDKREAEWLIKLSYKGDFVFMWRVTWQYIVTNAVARSSPRKKGRKAKS